MKDFTPIIVAMMLSSSASCVLSVMNSSGGGSGGFWGGFTSGLMNPFGGVNDLFNLATKGSGHTLKEASAAQYCEVICGDCSQTRYNTMAQADWISSAEEAKAICTGNRSGFTGSQSDWDAFMARNGTCCP